MNYGWKPYSPKEASLVDTWLDDMAIRATGLEDGWQNFYDYWMEESAAGEGKDCCFLISLENTPFAVLYLAILGGEMTISEYLLAPDWRGRGHGTAVIKELLANAPQLLNTQAASAKAVVFPDNMASRRVFEKAGFALVSEQKDDFGVSLHYEYRFPADAYI